MHDLKIAAQERDTFAEFNYGSSLHKDEGVRIDCKRVEHCLKLAAGQESRDAQFNYGCFLRNVGKCRIIPSGIAINDDLPPTTLSAMVFGWYSE
jgi:TPR repeat protein